MNQIEEIDEAFDYWWSELGSNMPRPDPKETDDEYRERAARAAFRIASACFIKPSEGDGSTED